MRLKINDEGFTLWLSATDTERWATRPEGDYGKSGLHAVRKDTPHDRGEAWSFASQAMPD